MNGGLSTVQVNPTAREMIPMITKILLKTKLYLQMILQMKH